MILCSSIFIAFLHQNNRCSKNAFVSSLKKQVLHVLILVRFNVLIFQVINQTLMVMRLSNFFFYNHGYCMGRLKYPSGVTGVRLRTPNHDPYGTFFMVYFFETVFLSFSWIFILCLRTFSKLIQQICRSFLIHSGLVIKYQGHSGLC